VTRTGHGPGFALILLWAVIGLVSGIALGQEPDIPDPVGYVNDFTGSVEVSYEQGMTAIITELRGKTGVEISVVTVGSTAPMNAQMYALRLFEQWGIGQAREDNGVVILAAMDDRQWFIKPGYGLEGVITDAMASRIGRTKLVPAFQQGEYGRGLFETCASVAKLIADDAGITLASLDGVPESATRIPPERPVPSFAPLIFFILMILFFIISGGRRGGRLGWIWALLLLSRGGYWSSGGRGGFGGFGGSGGFGGFGGGTAGGAGAGSGW
jgi:uncharacterized protein